MCQTALLRNINLHSWAIFSKIKRRPEATGVFYRRLVRISEKRNTNKKDFFMKRRTKRTLTVRTRKRLDISGTDSEKKRLGEFLHIHNWQQEGKINLPKISCEVDSTTRISRDIKGKKLLRVPRDRKQVRAMIVHDVNGNNTWKKKFIFWFTNRSISVWRVQHSFNTLDATTVVCLRSCFLRDGIASSACPTVFKFGTVIFSSTLLFSQWDEIYYFLIQGYLCKSLSKALDQNLNIERLSN